MRAKFPDLTAGQIANRLVKSAGLPPPGEKGLKLPDPRYGYGFIQPLKALTADIPAGSTNGPLKTPKADSPAGTAGTNAAGVSGNGQKADYGSGLGMGAIVGIAVAVLVVAGIIVIVVARQKKNGRNGPPPGGFGGPGGTGLPPHPSGPYQQQGVYQQPGPYQQQPGSLPPPTPPTQPPGQ